MDLEYVTNYYSHIATEKHLTKHKNSNLPVVILQKQKNITARYHINPILSVNNLYTPKCST